MSHALIAASPTACPPLPRAFTEFSSWPDEAFVQIQVVALLFDCSRSTVWRRIKQGIIPAPVKLAESCAAWRVGELREALALLAGGTHR